MESLRMTELKSFSGPLPDFRHRRGRPAPASCRRPPRPTRRSAPTATTAAPVEHVRVVQPFELVVDRSRLGVDGVFNHRREIEHVDAPRCEVRPVRFLNAISRLFGDSDGHSRFSCRIVSERSQASPRTRYVVARRLQRCVEGVAVSGERHAPEVEVRGVDLDAVAPGRELLEVGDFLAARHVDDATSGRERTAAVTVGLAGDEDGDGAEPAVGGDARAARAPSSVIVCRGCMRASKSTAL